MKLDTTLHAETPEGIDILLRPAGMAPRVLAYSIDWMIRLVVAMMGMAAMQALGGIGLGLSLVLAFGLEWLYPIVFELLPGAATPGKRVLGLQVMMDDGLPITPAASVTPSSAASSPSCPASRTWSRSTTSVRPPPVRPCASSRPRG